VTDDHETVIAAAMDAAEEVHDPLDGLVTKTSSDPGAPFVPDVLELIAALKNDDRAGFEALRSQLKKAGCRVTALDEAIAEENGEPGGRGPTQADILIELAQSAELFRAPDGTGFADLDINGHRETWPIRAKGFRRWLARRFFEATSGAPSSEALQSALNVIEAKAHFDAPECPVYIRVGVRDGRLYLDLCDGTWRAVEICTDGWRVIDTPPVRFRRAAGVQPLPAPVAGGSVNALRSFLNVKSETDFVLVVAWALAVLRNRGPYPVLVLSGEQGSAKSTFSAILRALLDPNTAPLRALPREDRDLFIAASNGHVLAFDNVSGLPAWISDTLCRLATGGGFAVRGAVRRRPAGDPERGRGHRDAARPSRPCHLSDAGADPGGTPPLRGGTVGRLRSGTPAHPRRAARCSGAGPQGPARHTPGKAAAHGGFCSVGDGQRDRAMARRHLLVGLLRQPRRGGGRRDRHRPDRCRRARGYGGADGVDGNRLGTSGRPGAEAGERVAKSKTWPDSPRALAGRLRRAATFLRKIGIEISFRREGRARTRIVRITAAAPAPETGGTRPSASSAPSAPITKTNIANGFAVPSLRTVANDADGSASGSGDGHSPTVRANPLKFNAVNDADGADANHLAQSGPEGTSGWRARL
jgi:hypothetical protein